MSKNRGSRLTTVNAPYSVFLDGVTLAHCLVDLDFSKTLPGQVSSFLGELPLIQRKEFAEEYGIALDDLKAFAAMFSAWSGENYPLAA